MVKRIINKKIFLGVLILIIISSAVLVFIFVNNSKENNTTKRTDQKTETTKTEDSSKPTPTTQISAPSNPTTPDFCKSIEAIVANNAGFTSPGLGRSATSDNIKLTECTYSKDKTKVIVVVYEYKDEITAKAQLSKRQVRGYSVKNKGKYIVSVLVISGDQPNSITGDKILNSVLEKL